MALYALAVPLIHFLLYPLGLLEPASRSAREVYSLIYVVLLGTLAAVHQRMLEKDRRRAVRSLRGAEESLFRSQRLESIGRLAGGIAHDFNNYLTVIRGFAELLRDRHQDPDALAEVGYIEKAADKATHLTRQLLAFGRRQVLRPEALDLNAVVLDTIKILDSLLGEDIAVEVDLDPQLGLARADLGQTEQVLMNLALNSRDAMPGGGRLTIRTSRTQVDAHEAAGLDLAPGPYVDLIVSDNGRGMTAEVLENAFEPFYSTKGEHSGTGLGLSTVHGIVVQSGGAISLESARGEGTTVRVRLPAEDEVSAREERSPVLTSSAERGGSVLVVEDEQEVRRLAVRALEREGFDVLEASSGPDALALLAERSESVDLLITDIVMPEMNGVELAANAVASRPDLRVLFISGYPAQTRLERKVSLPASVPFLEKPFTPSRLVAEVRQVLEQRPQGIV